MRTETINICKFSELSDTAKEKARDWWRKCAETSSDTNSALTHLIEEDLAAVGYPTADIDFSLSYCQGDGVAFYTDYHGKNKRKRQSGEKHLYDVDLRRLWIKRIARAAGAELRARIQPFIDKYGVDLLNQVNIAITRNSYGHRYSHYNTMTVDVSIDEGFFNSAELEEVDDLVHEVEELIQEDVKDISRTIERAGYKEYEYQTSAEYVDERIGAGSYEFTEDGEFHG